jgi:hypothetical protein
MDITYISALAVLAGSVIGGLTSTGTTWLTQRAHARSGLLANEIFAARTFTETSSAPHPRLTAMHSSATSRKCQNLSLSIR